MIEDRLRAVRLHEPRLDLDVDELMVRASRRRAVLGAIVATCAVVMAVMTAGVTLGGREPTERTTRPAAVTTTVPATPPPTAVDDCVGTNPAFAKVITTHVPKARLDLVSGCPALVYRIQGTSELISFGAGVPDGGYELTDDLSGPRDGRLLIYQGADKGELAVLLVTRDGTMVSAGTTGGMVDLDVLIALVTDPALR